jgi:MFS family permease
VTPSAWQPLRHRDFRGLWGCSLAVHLANWMQQVGAASLMSTLTATPAMTALVQTAASLPAVLLGLPAGAMADLIERRRWLIFTQSLILCIALLTVAVIAGGLLDPWRLLGLTALLGVGFALHAPGSQAVVSEVVPREELPSALALGGISYNISRVAGPALAGALVVVGGGAAVYGAVALCCLAMLGFLRRWPGVQRLRHGPPERPWSALLSGLRYVREGPACQRQLLHILVFMACGSATWALLPVLARDAYGLSRGGYGLLLGAFGVGGVLGVFVIAALRDRLPPHRVVALSTFGFALVPALLALSAPLWLALPALVWGGAMWMCGASSIYAAVQGGLPDWVRSRGLSIYNLVYFGAMAGGSAFWGVLTEPLGTPLTMAASAVATVLTAAWHWHTPMA